MTELKIFGSTVSNMGYMDDGFDFMDSVKRKTGELDQLYICHKCGAEIFADEISCPICGARQPEPNEDPD